LDAQEWAENLLLTTRRFNYVAVCVRVACVFAKSR